MSKRKEKVSNLPKLNNWVDSKAAHSDDPFVRDARKWIAFCFELRQKVPRSYKWRRIDSESFQKLCLEKVVASQKPENEFNHLYWMDQARNVEAYNLMTYWRGLELLETAIRSLNLKQVTPAAILARSLLELASAFLWNSNRIGAHLSSLDFRGGGFVVSEEFEAEVVKMIWGTRLGKHEAYLSQKSVLTTIQKLAKNPDMSELWPRYEYLCELAHPNFVGNARFWSHIEEIYPDGSQTVVIDQNLDDGFATEIVENTLWAITWSAVCIRNSFEMSQAGIQLMMGKLQDV